jgi:hypothetical protein
MTIRCVTVGDLRHNHPNVPDTESQAGITRAPEWFKVSTHWKCIAEWLNEEMQMSVDDLERVAKQLFHTTTTT